MEETKEINVIIKPNSEIQVFVVDDDHMVNNMYKRKFTDAGYQVRTAFNGQEMIDQLKDGTYIPDVVVVDMLMPEMGGIEALSIIRKNNYIPDAMICVLTNQSQTFEIQSAKMQNVDGYIVKSTVLPHEVVEEVIKMYIGKLYNEAEMKEKTRLREIAAQNKNNI